jgi:phosphoribosyl 1,2-cyclic phosphodiesterase
MGSEELLLRINGVLSDVDSDKANTSASISYKGFHLLIDAGNAVSKSLQQDSAAMHAPNAILITNPRKHHISDLPSLVKDGARIYCTAECSKQIVSTFPQLSQSIEQITPGTPFTVGPFQVTPLAADNAGDNPGSPGSVVYVVQADEKKIVAAWDFLTLPGANEKILWNPDLAIIGAETYNDHPSTGMISVSEAYNIVKRWNARTSYLVHYSGEKDREDARNQWHRGPAGPLSPDALQAAINEHLKIMGEGKYAITVGKEGMTWTPPEIQEDQGEIGRRIHVDSLDRHSFAIEKTDAGKVIVTIEDSISELINEFINPTSDGKSLRGEGVKSMLLKGPELQLIVSDGNVRIDITKGKKPMFAKTMEVSEKDSDRLKKYLNENFMKVQAMQERSNAA